MRATGKRNSYLRVKLVLSFWATVAGLPRTADPGHHLLDRPAHSARLTTLGKRVGDTLTAAEAAELLKQYPTGYVDGDTDFLPSESNLLCSPGLIHYGTYCTHNSWANSPFTGPDYFALCGTDWFAPHAVRLPSMRYPGVCPPTFYCMPLVKSPTIKWSPRTGKPRPQIACISAKTALEKVGSIFVRKKVESEVRWAQVMRTHPPELPTVEWPRHNDPIANVEPETTAVAIPVSTSSGSDERQESLPAGQATQEEPELSWLDKLLLQFDQNQDTPMLTTATATAQTLPALAGVSEIVSSSHHVDQTLLYQPMTAALDLMPWREVRCPPGYNLYGMYCRYRKDVPDRRKFRIVCEPDDAADAPMRQLPNDGRIDWLKGSCPLGTHCQRNAGRRRRRVSIRPFKTSKPATILCVPDDEPESSAARSSAAGTVEQARVSTEPHAAPQVEPHPAPQVDPHGRADQPPADPAPAAPTISENTQNTEPPSFVPDELVWQLDDFGEMDSILDFDFGSPSPILGLEMFFNPHTDANSGDGASTSRNP